MVHCPNCLVPAQEATTYNIARAKGQELLLATFLSKPNNVQENATSALILKIIAITVFPQNVVQNGRAIDENH